MNAHPTPAPRTGQHCAAGRLATTDAATATRLQRPGMGGLPPVALCGPQTAGAKDGVLIAADADLLNTAALARSLGLPAITPQGDLLAAAHARWGAGMADHLLGGFAIVIWAPATATLTALRDRFGIRPLVYAATPRGIVLASDPATAGASIGTRPDHDEVWIADFLAGRAGDGRRTAWCGVHVLPPGHRLVWRGGRAEIAAWWRPAPRDLPAADHDPAALHQALSDATRAAMTGNNVAALLSGGLDSSALALLAARQSDGPVATWSLRFAADPAQDEGAFIDAALAAGNFHPRMIAADAGPFLTAAVMQRMLAEQQQPFPGYGLPTGRLAYAAAAAAGHDALIDGHGGDEVIGSGIWAIEDLARAGDWPGVWSMLRRVHGFLGQGASLPPFLTLLARHGRGPLARRLAGRLQRHLAARARGTGNPDAADPLSLLSPDLMHRTALTQRMAEDAAAPDDGLPIGFALHARQVQGPAADLAFGVLDRATRAAGILPRYPFYDPHVVDLCLNRRGADKIAGGRPRALLRDAMAGTLPEVIRQRPGKANFLPGIARGLAADPGGRIRALATAPPERLAHLVHLPRLRQAAAAVLSAQAGAVDVVQLWRALWLDLWLEQDSARPAATPIPLVAGHPA